MSMLQTLLYKTNLNINVFKMFSLYIKLIIVFRIKEITIFADLW